MKKIITSLLCVFAFSQVQAQTATTVSTSAGYANNIWYSFENGNAGTAPANNWDIALAATISPAAGSLASSILFNYKSGTLFVAPSATPVDDFADLDTTGMANTWTKLYNSDQTWASGAFNQPAGAFPDYGWGNYDFINHSGINASRIFVIRSAAMPYTYKKLYISLSFASGGVYTITYDKLDNSDPQTATVGITAYATKNFVYYSLSSNAIADREPASSSWDVLFTQYITTSEDYRSNPSVVTGTPNQPVGGVLLNKNITAAQANNVADRTTYQDAASQTFGSEINTIGWDWKYLNASFAWEVVSDTVYFIQRSNGDIYSLYFTSFGGSANGNYNFTQQKVSTVTGIFGEASKASLAVYPNPTASGNATVLYDFSNTTNAVLNVSDLTGNVMYSENISSSSGLHAYTFSTAAFKTGLYIVSLTANGGVLQQKLVIK